MSTRITPAFAVAYCTSTHCAQFGDQIPTRSPLSSPAAHQPACERVNLRRRIRRRYSARILMEGDERLLVRHPAGDGRLEARADRLAEQRCLADAARV